MPKNNVSVDTKQFTQWLRDCSELNLPPTLVETRSLRASASNVAEATAITVAGQLLRESSGVPKTLLIAFQKEVNSRVATLEKKCPTLELPKLGRIPNSAKLEPPKSSPTKAKTKKTRKKVAEPA